MFRIPYLLLVFVCAFAQARPITLAWDNPGWPDGTTVELEANGVTVSGIIGTEATLDVPLVPGEGLFARARAHADGLDPSEWASLTVTYPRDPVAVWADRTEPDLTPVAISNPVLLGQGSANGVNSYNVTLGTNPSAGDLIVVMMVFADATSSVGDSAVSDNKGHTYTRQTQSAHYLYSGYYARSEIWTTVCTTTGGTFTVTINPPVTTGMYSSAAVTGVSGQATSFVDTAESSTGTSSSPSANIANLTDAGDLVLGVMTYNWYGVTIAPGSGWTQLVEIDEQSSTYQALSSIWRKPGATGAYDPAWTISGGGPGWVASGIAILPSAGGTPGNATPSGISSTGSVGTTIGTGKASAAPTGVSGTSALGTSVGSGKATTSPDGVSATAVVGTAVAEGAHSALPDGVEATAAVGTAVATGAASAQPDGVSATAEIGTATASAPASASPDGVSATASVGTTTATGAASAQPDGVSATAELGDVAAEGADSALPDGVSATASVGTATATGAATAEPDGVSATAGVGTATASAPASASPDGVSVTSAVGTAVGTGAATAEPDGVSVTAATGQATAIGGGSATAYPDGVSAAASVGTAVAVGGATAAPAGLAATSALGLAVGSGAGQALITGVSALANVGNLVSTGAATASPSGVSATAYVGTPLWLAEVLGYYGELPVVAAHLGLLSIEAIHLGDQ